jgi:hypothetical protein
MRCIGAVLISLAAAFALNACSGSGETGSNGGWRVSGAHIRIVGAQTTCPTPAPVLDTFSSTPSPNPDCTPGPNAANASAAPTGTPAPVWRPVHTEDYRSATQQNWRPIYTTYTAPPGTGIYQPMVHATEQPMPTPFNTPTPTPPPTPAPLPSPVKAATNPPDNVAPSYPPYTAPTSMP